MSNILERNKLREAYENVMLSEAKTGIRRKLQLLDDSIDEFIDYIEKKASNIDDNPVFQKKVFQMISDATKEHAEFLMAMKRVAATLDSGAQVIPKTQTSMQFKKNVNPYDDGEEPQGEIGPADVPPPEPGPGQQPSNEDLSEAISMKNIKLMIGSMEKVQKAVEYQVSLLQGPDLAKGASLATDLSNLSKKYISTLVRLEELMK